MPTRKNRSRHIFVALLRTFFTLLQLLPRSRLRLPLDFCILERSGRARYTLYICRRVPLHITHFYTSAPTTRVSGRFLLRSGAVGDCRCPRALRARGQSPDSGRQTLICHFMHTTHARSAERAVEAL